MDGCVLVPFRPSLHNSSSPLLPPLPPWPQAIPEMMSCLGTIQTVEESAAAVVVMGESAVLISIKEVLMVTKWINVGWYLRALLQSEIYPPHNNASCIIINWMWKCWLLYSSIIHSCSWPSALSHICSHGGPGSAAGLGPRWGWAWPQWDSWPHVGLGGEALSAPGTDPSQCQWYQGKIPQSAGITEACG